jgi:hypothetical protein
MSRTPHFVLMIVFIILFEFLINKYDKQIKIQNFKSPKKIWKMKKINT